jgi:hypothetical protein
MDRILIALSSIVVVLLLLGSALGPAVVGNAGAAVGNVDARPDSYVVEQGDRCIPVDAVGDASETISAHYDYRSGIGTEYASYGTTDRQASQVSQLYVFRGSQGDSLLFLHDRLQDDAGGGSVSMSVEGLPVARNWTVEDDDYQGQNDRFQHGPTGSDIDWVWAPNRTDGAAVRGVAESGYAEITIDATFGEGSYGDEALDWPYADDDLDWRVGNGDGTLVPLDGDDTVAFRHGTCSGATPPNASLTASPETPNAGVNVTLDASDSEDDDDLLGPAPVRLDRVRPDARGHLRGRPDVRTGGVVRLLQPRRQIERV